MAPPDISFIPDVPKGPLDAHRAHATFNWKHLRILMEGEENLRIKYKVWDVVEADPLFSKSKCTLPADEQKYLAAKQMNRVAELQIVPNDVYKCSYKDKTRFLMSVNEALHAVCPSLSVKIALAVGLFNNALLAMGTERHLKYYNSAWNREIITCLAITEVSHGSNTKSVRTTAVYDPKTKEFVIHTPDFEAAKCMIGNLGKTATIALTFANLYTADGVNHGLHGFIIHVRDPKTLTPYPGVVVGDIGEKVGLNGIDNGFMLFSHYRIPRESLLNRTGDVTPDGTYESVFSEPGKILGAALESFSAGRVGIMQESANTLSSAVVIATRYAALRKQFGPDREGPEVSIIDYQLHQWRIFPYLAAACVLKIYVGNLSETYLNTIEKSQKDSNGFEVLSQYVSEIHALVSSSKPLITWTARDAIQEAREACGGHGYLKAANLGELRNNHDPCCTYEGDNNVLMQQASNYLLRQWEFGVESPIGSAQFIRRRDNILKCNFNDVVKANGGSGLNYITSCYEWLMCWLLDATFKQMQESIKMGKHKFDARNDAQVYRARDLSKAYAEYFVLLSFRERCTRDDISKELLPVLDQLYTIYGLWSLDKHLATFYLGGFAKGSEFADSVRGQLLTACGQFKDIAVSIADALAPPDFALNSVLGKADGLLYQNLQSEFMTNPGALEKARWWADVIPPKAKL